MFASSEAELLELALRIMADSPPQGTADAVFMYGQTESNENSTLQRACEILGKGLAKKVAFSQGAKLVGGEDWVPDYRTKLIKLGVPSDVIIPVQITSRLANTHTEAIAFVAHAKKQKWQKVYAIASPFHQPRAFVETVTIVLQEYPELKAYSKPGLSLSWTQEAIHSQNIVKGKRSELVRGEWTRVLAYYEHGDLVSARQVLDYLNNRDQ